MVRGALFWRKNQHISINVVDVDADFAICLIGGNVARAVEKFTKTHSVNCIPWSILGLELVAGVTTGYLLEPYFMTLNCNFVYTEKWINCDLSGQMSRHV